MGINAPPVAATKPERIQGPTLQAGGNKRHRSEARDDAPLLPLKQSEPRCAITSPPPEVSNHSDDGVKMRTSLLVPTPR